jgi:hypothetical protein
MVVVLVLNKKASKFNTAYHFAKLEYGCIKIVDAIQLFL